MKKQSKLLIISLIACSLMNAEAPKCIDDATLQALNIEKQKKIALLTLMTSEYDRSELEHEKVINTMRGNVPPMLVWHLIDQEQIQSAKMQLWGNAINCMCDREESTSTKEKILSCIEKTKQHAISNELHKDAIQEFEEKAHNFAAQA